MDQPHQTQRHTKHARHTVGENKMNNAKIRICNGVPECIVIHYKNHDYHTENGNLKELYKILMEVKK